MLQNFKREIVHFVLYLCLAPLPSEGGSRQDIAYRCYRKRTLEQGLLERKQKLKRVTATLDLYTKKELRETNKGHYQHLVKLQTQLRPSSTACSSANCTHVSLPFASKCCKRILIEKEREGINNCKTNNKLVQVERD